MKKAILSFVFILAFVISANAQKVYPADNENQADLKLFIVNNENQADLCVYSVNDECCIDKDHGKWFFINNEKQAEKTVYFVDNIYNADLKIYFVKNENQAKWQNNSKGYLMK
jgi:hypothetical protein